MEGGGGGKRNKVQNIGGSQETEEGEKREGESKLKSQRGRVR